MSTYLDGRSIPNNCPVDEVTGGNGPLPSKYFSLATTNSLLVKTARTRLYVLEMLNTNASARYVKLYNKATAPTVGTDAPLMTFQLNQNVPRIIVCELGMLFPLGLGIGITGALADADTTAIGANDVLVNFVVA